MHSGVSKTHERQGLVPDFLFTYPTLYGDQGRHIVEFKFISAGATWYRGNKKSVDVRANQLPKLYSDKAKKVDPCFHRTERHQVGPIEQQLNAFGELQCLVLGQFGEGSQHVHDLLQVLATLKSEALSRSTGFPVSDNDRAAILHQYQRRLSITAVRAQAQCLLLRTGHLRQGAKDAANRRKNLMRNY